LAKHPIYQILEQRGKFFCPAKWTELFLYLNHGNSNSCHHPIPHKIPKELLSNPSVLHNTPHKLKMQQLMLDGHRPDECHNCWHIEDLGPTTISDRIHKSEFWADEITKLEVDSEYIPKFIEVVFDNTCNLMCSYCDSGSSTMWDSKIKSEKLILRTDYRKLYYRPAITEETNEYFNAWMRWWPNIKDKVEYLKFSGGEPLISKNCQHFLDTLTNTPQLRLAANTNLSYNKLVLEKLAAKSANFKSITISASIDAIGDIAEYSRQGLNYQVFLDNLHNWCTETPSNCIINIQSTTNIFNIWGVTDVFDLSIQLRKQYPTKVTDIYNTIVRFPEYQSISVLPNFLKQLLASKISHWLDSNEGHLSAKEKNYIEKIIVYLNSEPEQLHALPLKNLRLDLKRFIEYYDKTATKKFKDIYPIEFVNWIENFN
jgi:sulfatase maturation enzyme AslB (radical SAM superfamily)